MCSAARHGRPPLDGFAWKGAVLRKPSTDRAKSMQPLPTEQTQARRFGKARSARSTAVLEDYVELISDLLGTTGEARPTDIARRLGVSHPTAIDTIARLKREDLVTARPYRGVFLTEKGETLAKRVRTRHRLVVDVLLALGVPQEAAEGDAEGIEHHVSDVTLKAFAEFLRANKDRRKA
ncbi:manganese-binding transcriptional regulator MntR [Bradyrhizobium sp. AUGA SZCCT0160]|uniref:manganese-binding transcriptional regulator MntR n=1 Tax=Bradyrhizobium sp. AUGA SZCCT0160 TaxID=2807662 RepID=UPI001BAB809A|nr:manganese-binding transcriptional regulator MntR [Bradyrhizobium sp. AUGA SZCCT0160]MBR1187677.1 manganese-binding transcriptional regulator MntR [Bradyrhizobium sp. AUGA SZCCT0160]